MLQNYALNNKGLGRNAALRIRCANILLAKVLPDLQSIQGDSEHPLQLSVAETPLDEAARTILFALRLGAEAAKKKADEKCE